MGEPPRQKRAARLEGAAWAVLLIGFAASIALWQALAREQRTYIRNITQQQTSAIQHELASRMESRILALVRLARRSGTKGDGGGDWDDDAGMLYRDYGGFQAIERVGADGKIVSAIPVAGNAAAVGADLLARPDHRSALESARSQRRVAVASGVELLTGESGIIVAVPVEADAGGWVVGAFRLRELLSVMLKNMASSGYSVRISGAEGTLYETGERRPTDEAMVGSATVADYDLGWTVEAWPTKALASAVRTVLPQGVLIGGVLMSALLATTLQLARTASRRTRESEALNARLIDEVEQRRLAEAELRRSSQRLEVSNRELQDFASVASHDLQEPLRKIQAFGDRLRVKCAPGFTSDGLDYLDRMQNAAGRMQGLINDLLTFSRVTTKARPFVATDLAEVARGVIGDLEARIEQTGGAVAVSDLPEIDADAIQMRQLLQNLIGNGLKFSRAGVAPRVEVRGRIVPGANGGAPTHGAANHAEKFELTVADNGIGFDEKYLDRIFTVFQRLHGRSEYEGTGIGLAVCRKIAERHGGGITATSRPGEGSTFVVTLPRRHLRDEEEYQGADA